MDRFEFIKLCKKNRKILDFSCYDISECLVGVSEEEYKKFEEGTAMISKENLQRLVRVLCIEDVEGFYLDEYIDVENLNKDNVRDIKEIVEKLVGEVDA